MAIYAVCAIYAALPGLLQDLILALLSIWRAAPTIGFMAIKRSKPRFHWFDEAQKRHPGLGTLGYLPIEVRNLIYAEVIRAEVFRAVKEYFAKHNYTFDPEWDIRAEVFVPYQSRKEGPLDRRFRHDLPAFRAASRTVQSEMHRMYFSTTMMRLDSRYGSPDPRLRILSTQQTDMIRRVAVNLDPGPIAAFWIAFLRPNPLPNLQTVVLHRNHQHGQRSYLKRLNDHATFRYCSGEHCNVGRGTTNTDGSRCKHVQRLLKLATERLRRGLVTYELIAKIPTKNAPNVSIQPRPRPEDCSACYEKCEAILQHVKTHEDGRIVPTLVPTLRISFKWQYLE
ncbi:MAG: hypothetical protein LQ346_006912 [Caloplaca aetnensis]|nr:MAG: hypothetical protein LQ346_006912 [Caloplaca aetnensis]